MIKLCVPPRLRHLPQFDQPDAELFLAILDNIVAIMVCWRQFVPSWDTPACFFPTEVSFPRQHRTLRLSSSLTWFLPMSRHLF